MHLITVSELARESGKTTATIANHCRRLGFRKIAGTYILTPAEADRVRQSMADTKIGRPAR